MAKNFMEFWSRIRVVYIAILVIYALLYTLTALSYTGVYLFPVVLISLGALAFQSVALAYYYRSSFSQIEKSNERLEELAAKKTDELQESNKAAQALISNISHDLRTPMTAIRGYMELLMASPSLDGADMEYLEGACLRVAQMESLIDDLFLLTQLAEKKLTMRMHPMETEEFARIYQTQYRALTEEKGIRLIVRNDAARREAMIDRDFLMRIMDNLMQNAIYYAESKIMIRIKEENDFIILSVADDGPGIDPEAIPLIFDRFYKKRTNGTGLGLSIVKELAEAMGGEVIARSLLALYSNTELRGKPGEKDMYSVEIGVKLPVSN